MASSPEKSESTTVFLSFGVTVSEKRCSGMASGKVSLTGDWV